MAVMHAQAQHGVSRKDALKFGLVGLFGVASLAPLHSVAARTRRSSVPTDGADVFAILRNDHDNILPLIDNLILKPHDRQVTLEKLMLYASVCNATKENFIYPAVGKLAQLPADAAYLFEQQSHVKTALWALNHELEIHPSDDGKFVEIANDLRTLMRRHTSLEENVEFPKLGQALSPERLAQLTEAVRGFRKALT